MPLFQPTSYARTELFWFEKTKNIDALIIRCAMCFFEPGKKLIWRGLDGNMKRVRVDLLHIFFRASVQRPKSPKLP